MSTLGVDTFAGRSVTGSWGSASDGQSWIQAYGAGTLSVSGGEGTITASTSINTMLLGTGTGTDVDIRVRFTLSSTADTASITFRSDSTAQNAYRCRYTTNNVQFTKIEAGTTTSLLGVTTITITPGHFYWFHVQAVGSTFSYNFWADGSSEPAGWMATKTDTTFPSGQFGVHAKLNATSDVAQFDHFTALSLTTVLDLAARAGVGAHTDTLDLAVRARCSQQQMRSLSARCRIFANASTRDLNARAKLSGLAPHDLAVRANVDERVVGLPPPGLAQLAVTLGDAPVTPMEGTFSIGEDLSGRSTCQFQLDDPTGQMHLYYRQPISVIHSIEGEIFRGFVNTIVEENRPPNTDNVLSVSCIDEHWLADKRAYEGDEFANQQAGVIASFLAHELAEEGVTSCVAIDYDTTQDDFSAGTLTGVVAAQNMGTTHIGDGDLELQPAGQTLTIVESSLSDFLAGTLTNLQANGQGPSGEGFLSMQVEYGIKYTASATVPTGGNLYTYNKIWQGNYTIAVGDLLSYSVWIAGSSPQIKCALDIVFTDGTTLRDLAATSAIVDQQGISPHPNQDLTYFAKDTWYTRGINLTNIAGKTTSYVSIAFEGDQVGNYTAYFRDALISSANGVITTFFAGPTLEVSPAQQLQNSGYANANVEVIALYNAQTGTRISPSYTLDQVGLARQSIISWDASIPSGGTLTIEASLDLGITWQPCVSLSPIPGVVPGMNMSGVSLMLRETITNTSGDPTSASYLFAVQATIDPSYNAQKRDIVKTVSSLQDWSSGTLTNCQWLHGALSLLGFSRTWTTANLTQQTTYGNSSPGVFVTNTALRLQSQTGAACISRMDFAGQWSNFICEVDVQVNGSSENLGIVFRTTGWQNNNDTYAYSAFVNTGQIALGRGTNSASGVGSFTLISSVSLSLSANTWYRLKVVATGNSFQLYLNDALYINTSDPNGSPYLGLGYLGLRYYNNTGSTASGYFSAFGVVQALSGTRISPTLDLSSLQTIQDSYLGATQSQPAGSALLIEASTDGGTTWTACTSGQALPALPQGMDVSASTLSTRITLSTNSATSIPSISGLSMWMIGALTSSGVRISPPLALSQIGGRLGNSLISWKADLPTDGTQLGVDVSTDGVAWMDISTGSGQPLPLWDSMEDPPFIDSFSSDQTSAYISTAFSKSESFPATWTVDPVEQVLVASGGSAALLVNTNETISPAGEIIVDLDHAENAGIAWQLSANYTAGYFLSIRDSEALPVTNRLRLYRVQGGVISQLCLGAQINFPRGTPTRFQIIQTAPGVITVKVDGGTPQEYIWIDPFPLLAPGPVALRSNGGTSRFLQWRVQSYGDDVSSQTLYTRLRLSTTDPRYSPQVLSLTVAVYGQSISTGALIPTTSYSTLSGSTNTIAQDWDDLARQSSYWWRIIRRQLFFQAPTGVVAPFIVTDRDMLVGSRIQVTRGCDLYRNEQIIIGGTDVQSSRDQRRADGFRQGFDTGDPIDSIDSILVNGQAVSFGLQGVDTGKSWYYQQGQKGITQDPSATPLPDQTLITINYQGIVPVIAKARHPGQIAILAALDGTSGVVTVVEKADGLDSAAARQLAVSRLTQYAVLSVDLSFTTLRRGLHIGQLLTVFLPQHGLSNQTFLITKVDYAPVTTVQNGTSSLLEYFTVESTSGPIVGSWQHLFE